MNFVLFDFFAVLCFFMVLVDLLWLAFFLSLDRSVFLFISLLWIDVTGIFLLILFALRSLGFVELVWFDFVVVRLIYFNWFGLI